ncbi:hypothetical protein VPHD518_0064 [Vibrio phage D518]
MSHVCEVQISRILILVWHPIYGPNVFLLNWKEGI